jgi:hypothetical protein
MVALAILIGNMLDYVHKNGYISKNHTNNGIRKVTIGKTIYNC